MSTITATAVPTAVNGVTVPADQHALAVAYLAGIDGPDTVEVVWQSAKSVKQIRAAHRGKSLISHTSATVERGGTYAERAGIDGPESLPWGAWLVPDYLIFHNGQVYARLYMVAGTSSTFYAADGKPVTHAEWATMVYKSSGGDNPTGCIAPKLANLTVL